MHKKAVEFKKLPIRAAFGAPTKDVYVVIENGRSEVMENFRALTPDEQDLVKDLIVKMATVDGLWLSVLDSDSNSAIRELIDGIKAGAKAVKDELVGIAKGALKAAKDLIGAKSPSKVFAVEVGAPIVQGIAMGAKGAAGAAGRITGDAIAAASGVGAKTLSAPARGGGGGGIAGGVEGAAELNSISGAQAGHGRFIKRCANFFVIQS